MGATAAQHDRFRQILGAIQLRLQVLVVLVVAGHMLVHGLGLVELAFALKIEREVVHVAHHGVAHRDAPESVERHVELALTLQRQAHHPVGFSGLLIRFELAGLGHKEPLGRQREVPDGKQDRGKNHLHPCRATRQKAELDTQHAREQYQRDERCGSGRQARKQCNDIRRHQQEHRERGPDAPARLHDEVLAQYAGRDVRYGLRRGQPGITRHRKSHTHACRGRTDDHNLVGVFRCRNLAGQDVVERVDGKWRPAITSLVKLRQHQRRFVGFYTQLADLHRIPDVELDVARAQVEAFQRGQQRHGRHRIAVIIDQQRLLADRAINVLELIQVSDAGGRHTDHLDRLLPTDRGIGKAVLFADGALQGIGGKGFIGVALRFAERKDRGHQYVAGLLHTRREHRIGVERQLGLRDHLVQLRVAGRLVSAGLARSHQAFHLADETQTAIHLWLDEKHGMNNRLCLRGRKLVDQLRVDVPGPGPAADIGHALVVNGDDGDAVGRLARCAGAGEIVKAALQRSDQIGGLVQEHNSDHDERPGKPISTPELTSTY